LLKQTTKQSLLKLRHIETDTSIKISPHLHGWLIEFAPGFGKIDTRNTCVLIVNLTPYQADTFHSLHRFSDSRKFQLEASRELRLRQAVFFPEQKKHKLLRRMQTQLLKCFFGLPAVFFDQLNESVRYIIFK